MDVRSDRLRGLVRELTGIAAPSGNEDRLVAWVVERLEAGGLLPMVDRIGNVHVTFGGDGSPLLIFAHLDQVSLVVRTIESGGFVGIHRVGGIPERVLPGTRLNVHTAGGDLPGVVGLKAHHLTPPREKYVAMPADELYVDLGMAHAADVEAAGVRVGDPLTYATTWTQLGPDRFAAPSLDNRLGMAVLLELIDRLAKNPPDGPVTVAFSVQEEFNVRGTLALAAALQPAAAVCVDITPASDPPDLVGRTPVRLGHGPVLSRMSFHGRGTLGGLIPHPALVRGFETAASAAGSPMQYESVIGVITDAAFLPMATGDGIATVGVGIPVRYTHSPIETGSLADVAASIDLLAAFLDVYPDLNLSRGRAQLASGGFA